MQVVDASQALENRNKSVYDPDEQEEEDKPNACVLMVVVTLV